jgi:hypothetical protein
MATSSSYSPGQSIPLRRLSYPKHASSISTSSTSYPDLDNDSTFDDRSSINHSLISRHLPSWNPSSSLQVQSTGKAVVSLPTPVSQLEIPILSSIGEPIYVSVRPKRTSGSCTLFETGGQEGTDLGREMANTTYTWGPGRNPIVIINGFEGEEHDRFEITNKSIWNRTQAFSSTRWGRFEWRYAGRAERKVIGHNIDCLLVLEKILPGKAGQNERKVRLAMLIRGEGTRTPHTKASDAGNGGVLEICERGGIGEGEMLVDRVTVLVTALVMLKKEVDRLRGRQIAMIGHGGGGS